MKISDMKRERCFDGLMPSGIIKFKIKFKIKYMLDSKIEINEIIEPMASEGLSYWTNHVKMTLTVQPAAGY